MKIDFDSIYKEKLDEIEELYEGDTEVLHSKADELLCDLLLDIGYPKVVEKFKSLPKWYA